MLLSGYCYSTVAEESDIRRFLLGWKVPPIEWTGRMRGMTHLFSVFQNILLGNRKHGPKNCSVAVPGCSWRPLRAHRNLQQLWNILDFFLRLHRERDNIKDIITASVGHLTQEECVEVAEEPSQLGCEHHLWSFYRRHQATLWPPPFPSLILESTFHFLLIYFSAFL